MLLVTFTFFFLTVHQSLTLKCYYYEEQHGNFWIDTRTLPQFPTNYTIIEGKNQCAASIRWFTLPDGKESFVDYRNDMPIPNLPKNASFPFVVAGAHRELQAASTRALIYGCATDYCNNRTNLLKALTSLLLRENFAPLDILFSNGTRNFTEQNSCVEFSNATRIKCPSSATPLSSCSYCFLSEKDSPQEFCARCPEESGPSFDFAFREVIFLLKEKIRAIDQIELICRTTGCNALNNVNKIHQLSKIEFDFKNFFE